MMNSRGNKNIILVIISLVIIAMIIVGCTNADTPIATYDISPTYTLYPPSSTLPTYTPYPTYTAYPTIPSVTETWEHYHIKYSLSLDGYRGYTKVWMPVPTNGVTQQSVKLMSVSPTPEDIYYESMGNRIIYWIVNIQEDNFVFSTEYDLYILNKDWDISPENIGEYNPFDPTLVQYLNSSEWIQSDHPEILSAAQDIIGEENNPYEKVNLIIEFLRTNMTSGSESEDALSVIRTKEIAGCGAAAHIFVALSRAAGVPARIVSGVHSLRSGTYNWVENNFGTHLWCEFYLPNYGWIPVDPLWPEGTLVGISEGNRVIFSRGSDIDLGYGKGAVPWFHMPHVNDHQEEWNDLLLEVEYLGNVDFPSN